MAEQKTILRALAGEVLPTPPIWMMRQAGRYLPEYRATRAEAGDFLSLCYNPDLAAEVTLQPIRRYGFDAAILFADILLVPQALGADLWFVTGEGPRLSTITRQPEFDALKPAADIHDTLAPVYETVRILSRELPSETTLIGFAGAPWTVATYMIAGRMQHRTNDLDVHGHRGDVVPLLAVPLRDDDRRRTRVVGTGGLDRHRRALQAELRDPGVVDAVSRFIDAPLEGLTRGEKPWYASWSATSSTASSAG